MKVNLPSHPSQIKLKDFIAFQKAIDDVERAIVATGKSRKDVMKMKPDTISFIVAKYKAVAELSPSTLTRHVTVRSGLRSIRLSFIPNLETCSLAEWVDMDAYDRQAYGRPDPQNPTAKVSPDWDKLALLIGIMYRPLKEKFLGDYSVNRYDSENRGHIPFVLNMTMDVVNSAQVFFSTFAEELRKSSQDYLLKELKRTVTEIESEV